MRRALLRFPHLSFIPPVPYPPLRGTFPSRGRLCIGDSDALVYDALETIFPPLFHTASTLSGSLRSPPSPRREGFVRRYSFSTYACIRSDVMGKAIFSYRSLPHWGRGTAQRRSGALVNDALVTIFFALFHTASTLSGSLRSQPSPRREGFVSGTAALSQMPCLHSAQTKTALRGRALQSGFWFYYSTVTDFARFLGLSTSFPLLIEV